MTERANRSVLALALAVVTVALIAGAMVGTRGASDLWIAGAGLAMLAPMVLLKREYLLYMCLGAAYVISWMALTLQWLPTPASWILDVAIAVLFIRSVASTTEASLGRLPAWFTLLVGVVLVSGAFALVAGTPVPVVASGLRYYLRFPLLAISLVIAPITPGFELRFWHALLAIAILQLPVSLHQAVTVGPGDFAAGTFGPGGTSVEAVFVTAVAVTLMTRGLTNGRGVKPADVAIGLLLLVPVVIGFAVAMYVVIPLTVLFAIAIVGRQPRQTVGAVAMIGLAVGLLTPVALNYTATTGYRIEAAELLTSPTAALQYDQGSTSTGTTMGRLDQLRLSSDLITTGDYAHLLFGRGPGSASKSLLGPRFSGPLLAYPGVRFLVTALALPLAELGIIGMLAFGSVLVIAVVCGSRAAHRAKEEPVRILGAFTAILGFQMLLTAPYTNAWFLSGTALAFWMSLGLLLSRRDQWSAKSHSYS